MIFKALNSAVVSSESDLYRIRANIHSASAATQIYRTQAKNKTAIPRV